MIRSTMFVVALLWGVSDARATDLSGIDFLVDGRTYDGKEVTVRDCTIISALSLSVICAVQNKGNIVGNVMLDGATMDRSSLRRALTECAERKPVPGCRVDLVLGRVRATLAGEVWLDNAMIFWARM